MQGSKALCEVSQTRFTGKTRQTIVSGVDGGKNKYLSSVHAQEQELFNNRKQYDIPMISHLFHIWYNYQIISFCSAMLLKALQDVLSWQNS